LAAGQRHFCGSYLAVSVRRTLSGRPCLRPHESSWLARVMGSLVAAAFLKGADWNWARRVLITHPCHQKAELADHHSLRRSELVWSVPA